jgi:hypothetical protein
MEELKDYAGEFRPDIKYENLSKDLLAKLLDYYSEELILLNWMWYDKIAEKLGEEETFKIMVDIWCQIGEFEMKKPMEILNITGDDVATYVKTIQFIASFAQGLYDYKIELKDKNHAVLTVYECPALTSLEESNPEKIPDTCQWLEHVASQAYCNVVNPAIRVSPLKTPPRKDRDEIACQWELKRGTK